MRLILILAALPLLAQTPSVMVSASITATVGALTCTGTATVAANVSTMHLKCMDGADTVLPDVDLQVKAPGATTITVQRGANSVAWLLTKGNPLPDQWQVSATDGTATTTKTGTF